MSFFSKAPQLFLLLVLLTNIVSGAVISVWSTSKVTKTFTAAPRTVTVYADGDGVVSPKSTDGESTKAATREILNGNSNEGSNPNDPPAFSTIYGPSGRYELYLSTSYSTYATTLFHTSTVTYGTIRSSAAAAKETQSVSGTEKIISVNPIEASTAPTTTSTIFSATTSVPTSSLGRISTGLETSISSNPLVTEPVATSSASRTIETATLTESVQISTGLVSGTGSTSTYETLKTVYSSFNSSTIIGTSTATQTSLGSTFTTLSTLYSSFNSSSAIGTETATETSKVSPTQTTVPSPDVGVVDLFETIDTAPPPTVFSRQDLPLPLLSSVSNNGKPYQTNKFYQNIVIGDQKGAVITYPYSVFYTSENHLGLGVSHYTESDKVFGPTNSNGASSYFLNPTLVGHLVLSAKEFTSSGLSLQVSELKELSVLATLQSSSGSIHAPLVEGMGFVSGVYEGSLTLRLSSQVGFRTLTQETSKTLPSGVLKYRVTLFSDIEWLLYVTLPEGTSSDYKLEITDNYTLQGTDSVDGLIVQVAKAAEKEESEIYYDYAAGMYPESAVVTGSADISTDVASYSIVYDTKGKSSSGSTLVFALPHQVDSIDEATNARDTGIQLESTTKGKLRAYLTNVLGLQETLTSEIQFLPWASFMTKTLSYTAQQLQELAKIANDEISQDIKNAVTGLDSNYFSGKVLDKYAYILLVISDIIQDDEVALSLLETLKETIGVFTSNQQYYPLMYDTRYGGVTSTGSQGGDTGVDFGSAYYNDHHFHYGYFVHAAAVIGHVDNKIGNGTWAQANKDWVNSLVRDVANPSDEDSYFPVSRSFDWYQGHSWASGLFSAYDGRNQESSSEDYNFAYGMKLWGAVIGDASMEQRGNLMLSIMSRAIGTYFLFEDGNTVVPSEIVPNRVAGILFENKMDYTTYFGTNKEYIHGIHMLPITPASSLIRTPQFVSQEWSSVISSILPDVNSGWTGILRLNQALSDPATAFSFFSNDVWNNNYLDNGQSRTWAYAFSAGLANSA
ncbi:BA75_01409T0 [Komagataella pastoris]|uniref:glucan endo-1,3-beta-D-glucosidase n=1 Tax=Komagataella pastoris TaxID=4922 RepID=A0A1B2J5H5_PICPA|nr:BA75_01409T0 [Komagataella pastoris]